MASWLAGCDGASTESTDLRPAPAHVRERDVEIPAARDDGSIPLAVTVLDDEVGFLLSVRTGTPTALLSIARIVSPSGRILHTESGPIDDPSVDSLIASIGWAGEGELALFLPNAPVVGAMPGTWRIDIVHEDGEPLADAHLITVRRSAHDRERRLDLAIMDASGAGVAEYAQGATPRAARRARSARAVQHAAMDEVLAPHALGIGRIDVLPRAPRRLRGTLSMDGGSEADLCREAVRAADPWSLPVVIVDGFSGDGDEAEELIGWAPVPGVLREPDSAGSCVFVGSHRDVEDDDERQAAFAMTLLHEAGHFMGLEHVSEFDGRLFDRLDDTRECHIGDVDGRDDERFDVAGEIDGVIDDFECGRAGGADNLMFWSGVPEFAPFRLSDQQADVLRAHPLFHPLE